MKENPLVEKLESFVEAYYKNKAIRGLLLLLATSVFLFVLFALLEYFSYFSSFIRAAFFYCFIAVNVVVLLLFVLYPLLQRKGLLKRMSYEQAARMIGHHFDQIDDKLLNTLQLQLMANSCSPEQLELLLTCVEERTQQMNHFHFPLAVDFKKTKKYAKYLLIPLLLLILVFVFDKELFTKPTQRIVQYGHYFEKPAPYAFVVLNDSLKAFENDDFTIKIKVEGDMVPEEVFIRMGKVNYKLQQESTTEFSYQIRNIQSSTSFEIYTPEVCSQQYELSVLPKPMMVNFSMELEYPSYVARPTEVVENIGDVAVPQGTKIKWRFNSRNTDKIIFSLSDKKYTIATQDDISTWSLRAMTSFSYTVSNLNEYMQSKDSLFYGVSVIADRYPSIDVLTVNDTAFLDRFYFKGELSDDYGFNKLQFVYTISEQEQKLSTQTIDIAIDKALIVQDFYHYFDAQTLDLKPGQQVEYYFEVWDNDGVNGSKSSKSQATVFKLPTLDEIHQQQSSANHQTRQDLNKMLKEGDKILKQIDELKRKMVDKNQPTWQEKKQLEELLNQLQQLRKEGQEIVQEQKRQEQINEQFNDLEKEIIDKQKELQRRFDELFNDEMKTTIEQIQRLMERNLDQNKLNNMLDKVKFDTEEFNKQLDQNLELFKQLEMEAKIDNAVSKALRLSEEQEQLNKKTKEGKTDQQQLKQEQNTINEQFDKLQQELQEMKQINAQLESPYPLDSAQKTAKEIEQELNKAKEQLDKGQNQKAGQPQKNAAEKMKELAQEMENAMYEQEEEQLGEDIRSVRQILDNIVKVSMTQEEIMKKIAKTTVDAPDMRELIQQQYQLKDRIALIEDSISAVARRQVMIEPFVTKQVTTIKQAQNEIVTLLGNTQEPMLRYYYGNNNFGQVAAKQQFTMTSLNDLGLMLAESMKKMQQKQNASKSGKGNGKCSSDASGGKKNKSEGRTAKSMRQLQEQLNKQLQELRQQMQQGQQGQQGKQGKQGEKQPSLSEQFARMAAQQEAIRKMMQDYQSELKKGGKGYGGDIERMLKQMEQTEKELVNKTVNQQTIDRQQQILTRLLESEKAEIKREKDDKREGKQAVEQVRPTPPAFIEQELQRKRETELYKTIPPSLSRYYRDKANEYFHRFEDAQSNE